MIVTAKEEHIMDLAFMLKAMYTELFGAKASQDIAVYITEIVKHYNNPEDTVYIDEDKRGFFIIRDETEAIAPELKRYNGIRVYVQPMFRKSRVLSDFYTRLFKDFPDGDILGMTEINSEHIAVLDKRHELIAKVYKLKRR